MTTSAFGFSGGIGCFVFHHLVGMALHSEEADSRDVFRGFIFGRCKESKTFI